MDAEAQSGGLSDEQLNTELRLRQSRIKVSDTALEYVYVRVTTMKVSNGGWAYSAHIGVNQMVTFYRNMFRCTAETWDTGMIGTVSSREFVSAVRENVGDLVDRFINAYLAENAQ